MWLLHAHFDKQGSRLKPPALLIAFCCLCNSALAAPAPASYVLDNTEVRDIHAQGLKRDYQVYVALPDSYMLSDLREFDGKLTSRKFPNLKTRLRVFEDEDHASVFPFVLTHGLRAYLKALQ